jgi:hypothetical protein
MCAAWPAHLMLLNFIALKWTCNLTQMFSVVNNVGSMVRLILRRPTNCRGSLASYSDYHSFFVIRRSEFRMSWDAIAYSGISGSKTSRGIEVCSLYYVLFCAGKDLAMGRYFV